MSDKNQLKYSRYPICARSSGARFRLWTLLRASRLARAYRVLTPVRLELSASRRNTPEVSESRRRRFVEEYALSEYNAGALATTPSPTFFRRSSHEGNGRAPEPAGGQCGPRILYLALLAVTAPFNLSSGPCLLQPSAGCRQFSSHPSGLRCWLSRSILFTAMERGRFLRTMRPGCSTILGRVYICTGCGALGQSTEYHSPSSYGKVFWN